MHPPERNHRSNQGLQPGNGKQLDRLIAQCQQVFIEAEAARVLAFSEFVLTQVLLMKKRWWFLQLVVLGFAWQWLRYETDVMSTRRGLGILAALFVVLILPECFSNRRANCVEIELATLYTLRQIYAIRLMIYGAIDTCLITLFALAAVLGEGMVPLDVVVQFILPVVVTATICLVVLGHHRCGEYHANGWCLIWAGLWAVIVSNDTLYGWLVSPLLGVLFAAVTVVAGVAIRRLVRGPEHTYLQRGYGVSA